ncbi:hypothetical protein HD554DRAFT_2114908, partial [Boletus coccyginus]
MDHHVAVHVSGNVQDPQQCNMTAQCILPAELIVHILYYTDPRDIIRWRTVSKWFCAITHDPAIWRVLYANLPFIHPPGPFPSQSSATLERTLLRSARLAQSWMMPWLRAVPHVKIQFDGKPSVFSTSEVDFFGGRWFLVCQLKQRFVLYDTNACAETHVPQILWEQEEQIDSWDQCSMMSQEGILVGYMLLSEVHSRQWKLIEWQLDGESGMLYNTTVFNLPKSGFVPECLGLWGGKSRFLFIPHLQLMFDTRTRLLYKFPKFCIALNKTGLETDFRESPFMAVVPTGTHVLAFFSYPWKRHVTVIQAFTVPDGDPPLGENGFRILHLSHEGTSFEINNIPKTIIRNSIVDPITGSIGIRFLDEWIGIGRHPR